MNLHYSDEVKAAILSGQPVPERNNHAVKLQQALAWMGKRHVLHPANRVKRLAEPMEPYVWKPKVLRRVK
jgi:hypothetical protein